MLFSLGDHPAGTCWGDFGEQWRLDCCFPGPNGGRARIGTAVLVAYVARLNLGMAG